MELTNIFRQSYSGKEKLFPGGQTYFKGMKCPLKCPSNNEPLANYINVSILAVIRQCT